MNIEAQAKGLGVPFTIPITNDIRAIICTASTAELVSIEGEYAVYKGVCAGAHQYNIRVKIKKHAKTKKQKMEVQRTSSGISIGVSAQQSTHELESY